MNAERFLAYYEQVADAPDAIARLRRFIFDLAVRGKLVPQDAEDELASELLKRVEREKAKLVNAGRLRKPKQSEPIRREELPIDLPKSWAWARLCEIGSLSGGMTPSMNRSDFWNGDIVWLSPKDIKTDEVVDSELKISNTGLSEARLDLYRPGCLFIVARSGILKRTFPVSINRVPAAANQDMKVLVPFLDGQERYLQVMFRGLTGFLLRELVKTGTTVQSLKYAEFEQQPFPIPPLAEQHRIVAKVDELMGLCDRLEAARADREAARDRLAAASLARLNAPETALPAAAASPAPQTSHAFGDHARFVLDALPTLTARPDQIKALRQTVLNLAVRGKLVPQNTNEEPASTSLANFAKNRANTRVGRDWSKENKSDKAPRFDLPAGWCWTTIDETAQRITVGHVGSMRDQYRENGVPFLRSQNVRANRFREDGLIYISPEFHQRILKSVLYPGDVVVVRSGNVGTACVIPPEIKEANCSDLVVIQRPKCVVPEFMCFYLNSLAMTHVEEGAVGIALTHFNTKSVATMPLPLPPLAEQHRIVAKVDELMALCDKLEASLATAADTRRRLLDALLVEALAPDEDRLREAAE